MNNIQDVLLIAGVADEEERYEVNLNRRHLRDVSNPFTMPERQFKGIFRLSRQTAQSLLNDLLPHMPEEGDSRSIPNEMKIFVALQFFAQGCYQKAVGQSHFLSMCQSSVSRSVAAVCDAILNLDHLVQFPNTEELCNAEKLRFMQKYDHAYPGIIGAIDCTHVAIIAPPTEHEFRPGTYYLRILNCNPRYPGSVHDSAIWHTSMARQQLVRMYNAGQRNFWLIGDSGYPLEPWLMTTFGGANLTDAERRFNATHRSLRNIIERFNGVFKGRFRCLLKHRTLHYAPEVAGNIVNSCAILHNYCIARNEEDFIDDMPQDNDDDDDDDDNNNPPQNLNFLHEGRAVRNQIVQDYFH